MRKGTNSAVIVGLLTALVSAVAGGRAVGADVSDSVPTDSIRPARPDVVATARNVPGIPRTPNLVSVVPFEFARNVQPGQILFPAEIDGHHGTFLLDTGSPLVILNSKLVRPTLTKGIDTLLPGTAGVSAPQTLVKVHTVRIGTLLHHFDSTHVESAIPFPSNALILNDDSRGPAAFKQPVLGYFGIPALAPFETIIDYAHKRLVLIRLDSAGNRLAQVPAYTPTEEIPLVVHGQLYGAVVNAGAESDTLLIDTGTSWSEMTESTRQRLHASATNPPAGEESGWRLMRPAFGFPGNTVVWEVNHLVFGTREYDGTLFSTAESPGGSGLDILGYSFLKRYGAIGFNFRTHRFILYRTMK